MYLSGKLYNKKLNQISKKEKRKKENEILPTYLLSLNMNHINILIFPLLQFFAGDGDVVHENNKIFYKLFLFAFFITPLFLTIHEITFHIKCV